jgi:HEAT repeat protein
MFADLFCYFSNPISMSASEFITIMLSAEDAAVRRRAAEDLLSTSIVSNETIASFAKGLTDVDKGVRDICALALTRGEDSTVGERARAVAPLITNADIEVRNLAGDILLKLGNDAASALYIYLSDTKEDNRKFACDIIGLSGNADAIPYVRRLLTDEDDNVRCAAVEALGFLKATDMLGDIIGMYDDEAVRPYVIAAVGCIGGKHAQEFLLHLMNEEDAFVQIAAIDALSICADEIGIAHKLLDALPSSNPDVQPVILRTIYSIAFRSKVAIELPHDLRPVAHAALVDDDADTRIAGLLALGSLYEEEDIPALLHEIRSRNSDTQQHILSVILAYSSPAVVGEFFERVFSTLVECNSQITDFLGFLTSLLPSAHSENAAITVQSVMRQYTTVLYDQRREVLEFLFSISREAVIHLLSDEIASGKAERVEDAQHFATLYNIREPLPVQSQNV